MQQHLNSLANETQMIDSLVLQEFQHISKNQTVKAEFTRGGSYTTEKEKELQNICRLHPSCG